jgi:putative DNA primase/helicase
LTDHISFGKVGKGPNGERFIRIIIQVDEQRHTALLRFDDLMDGSRGALAPLNRLGAHLVSSAAKTEFLRRLQDLGPQRPSFKVATRVGPFGEFFVLPDQVLSARNKTVATSFDDALANYLSWGRTGGTLEEWKNLAGLAEGNSRLILAFGVAFVGPLRLIAPIEPVAFQLTGPGATAKTIIGVCTSSVWGQRTLGGKPHPLGGGDAWNNTVNNLERVLATRDHTYLFLDETHLASPKDIIDAIFMISEGQGRGRYNELRRWEGFVPILSTSNDSVAEILAKAREPADRAAFDRLVDVPLPQGGFGAFENLHGSDTLGDFVLRLKAIYDVHYGVVGRAYVLKILQELAEGREWLATWHEARRAYFIRVARKRVSMDSQHERVM